MPIINGRYYTEAEVRAMERRARDRRDDSGDFLTSAVVGAVTGSSLIGAAVGGSLLGGLAGDLFEGDDDSIF